MLPVQSRMARVALGLGVRDLATLAKVAPATISRFEAGEELKERTVDAIRAALETAGAVFVPENGDGPGVRLRKGVNPSPAVVEKAPPSTPRSRRRQQAEIIRDRLRQQD